MSERRQPSRRSQSSNIPGKLLKGFSLLLFTGFGYLLGVRVIGPEYGGHASTLPASTGSSARHPSTKPAQTTAQSSNAGNNADEPTAVITPGRHTAALSDAMTHSADRSAQNPDAQPAPHHHKVRPASHNPTKTSKEPVGDQSVLPEDKANVSGADNEPSHSSHHPDPSNLDTGLPGAGDEVNTLHSHGDGSDRGSSRTHHSAPVGESTHRSEPQLPGADESAPGDTTPITPHAGGHSHRDRGTDQNTVTEGRSRHWMAADRDLSSSPNA